MNLSGYNLYRETELLWLKKVPSHWKIIHLKSIGKIYSGGSIVNNDLVESGFEVLGGNGFMGYTSKYNVKNQNIIIGRVGAKCGNVRVIKDKKWISDNALILKLSGKNSYDYIGLLLEAMNLNNLSASSAQPLVTGTKVLNVLMPQPPLPEQHAIANYLSEKTTAIDKKISLVEKKIISYKELSAAVINRAVCLGLNKSVSTQKSGIKWVSELPKHWEVWRGKDLFIEKSRKGHPKEPLLAASQKQGVVLKTMLESRSMEAQKDFDSFKLVLINDFVISLRSFEGGLETAFYRGIISPVYTVFTSKKNLHVGYLKHLFKSSIFINNLKTMVTGIRDGQSIKFVEIQNTFFPVPPLNEQIAIAEYLDHNTKTIESIIKNLTAQINTLKDLRKTLISDVVTGKFKVSP